MAKNDAPGAEDVQEEESDSDEGTESDEMPFPVSALDLLSDEMLEKVTKNAPEVLYARLGSIVDGLIVSTRKGERGTTWRHKV